MNQEELKKVWSYCPTSGLFTRIKKTSNRVKVGDIATTGPAGYIYISLMGNRILAHRAAWLYMTGEWPSIDIDHVNRVRNDNRWENLRILTRGENLRNSKHRADNTSGVKGVSWKKDKAGWEAYINIGKRVRLGTHKDWFEAVCARKSAEVRLGYHP